MKKNLRKFLLCMLPLLLAVACGDEEDPDIFHFTVYNGESNDGSGGYLRAAGATVNIYAAPEAWLDGQDPIKTYTANAQGEMRGKDKFPDGAVPYVESGSLNNWPGFLYRPLQPNPNIADAKAGSASLFNTLMDDFMSVSNKSYLLTDLRVNGVSIFDAVSDCSEDNFLRLEKDGNLFFSEGSLVCEDAVATAQYNILHPSAKSMITITNSFYVLGISWADVNNLIYIKTDFSEINFKTMEGPNEVVSVYTKQD